METNLSQKLSKIIEKMSFIFLILFAVVGMLFATIVVHEETHVRDYEKYSYKSQTCYLAKQDNWKNYFTNPKSVAGYNLAWINYTLLDDENSSLSREDLERTEYWLEKRAFATTIFITIIGVVSIFNLFAKRGRMKEMEEELNDKL